MTSENYQKAKRYVDECEKVMNKSKKKIIDILPIVLKEVAATLPKKETKHLLTIYGTGSPIDWLTDYVLLSDTKYVLEEIRSVGKNESKIASSKKISYKDFIDEIGLENILSVVRNL